MAQHLLVAFNIDDAVRRATIELALKADSNNFWNYLPSVYILCSCVNRDAAWWTQRLQPLIDPQRDRFFVLELALNGSARNGWLPADAWNWLNAHSH